MTEARETLFVFIPYSLIRSQKEMKYSKTQYNTALASVASVIHDEKGICKCVTPPEEGLWN